MVKNIRGFTLIEILIVIAVIGVLATAAMTSYSSVLSDTKNSQRSTKIKTLTVALERYHGTNGEYPTCAEMTQSSSVVATLLGGIDPAILTTPGDAPGTNSIVCSDTTQDKIAYKVACERFTVTYNEKGAAKKVIGLYGSAAGGGEIMKVNGIYTHTFTSDGSFVNNCSATSITIDIIGAGGGGGGNGCSYNSPCYGPNGGTGGESNVQYPLGTYYRAYGGGGGEGGDGDCDCSGGPGSPGGTFYPGGFTPSLNTIGGGAAGGVGEGSVYSAHGGNGAAGGRLKGTISLPLESTVTIKVGTGGTSDGGGTGTNGVVTVTYS